MNCDPNRKSQSERILLAAFECISTKGYANVSMRDIAKEAGVVLSQLNYYFKNKEGLFKEVVRVMMDKYLRDIEKSLKAGDSPKKRIKSLIEYFRKMLQYNPKLFKLLYEFTGLALWSPTFSDLLRKLFKDMSDMIEKYILNKAHMKKFKGYSAESLSRLLIGSMFGTGIQAILDQDEEWTEALDVIQFLFE